MRKLIAAAAALLVLFSASAAVVNYTTTLTPDGQANTILVSWTPMLNGDTGQPASISQYSDRTVHVTGTFSVGGTAVLEGSNDGTNWSTLTDLTGTAISKTAAGVSIVAENPRFIRAHVTAGDGSTSLTVTVLGRR
jgi:hypothetical protein